MSRRTQELAAARRAEREREAAERGPQPRLTALGPGQELETRGVLAGAYRGRDIDDRTYLTHAVLVGPDGRDLRVLCPQPLDHVADSLSRSPEELREPPTCQRCLPRWERLREKGATMHENPVRLPPGVVEDTAPDEESRYGSDLGTNAKVTWSWLKTKYGKTQLGPDDTTDFSGRRARRLYIQVRPFDSDNQWLPNLVQEFTYDGLRDAQKYGFELIRDLPQVQGFWIGGHLDIYWTKRGRSEDMRVMDLGVYERAQQHTPNAPVSGYRGFPIDKIDGAIQAGHDEARTAGTRRPKTRNIGTQYVIHLEDGGTKTVSTMRAAREYIDNYLGPEHTQESEVDALRVLGGHTPNARHSNHGTVVEYAVQEMFKGKSPSVAAKNTALKLSGGTNMFIDSVNEIEIDPRELEDALWDRLADYAIRGLKPGNELGHAQGALINFNQWQWGKPRKERLERELLRRMAERLSPQHTPNARLEMLNPRAEESITRQLRVAKLRAARGTDLSSAVIAAGNYAKGQGVSCYVYQGNSHMHLVYRATPKKGEALSPVNNGGNSIFEVAPDLTVTRWDVRRPDEHTPNARHAVSNDDVVDALEHASDFTTIDPDRVTVSEPVMLSLSALRDHEDVDAWLDLDSGSDEADLRSFRGSEWYRRAEQWRSPEDVPPVVIVHTKDFHGLADGRGRVNYATARGWREIPVVFVTEDRKGGR